jgi:hypothetical protein
MYVWLCKSHFASYLHIPYTYYRGFSGYRRQLVSRPPWIIGDLLYDNSYTYKIPTSKCSKIIFHVIAFDLLVAYEIHQKSLDTR